MTQTMTDTQKCRVKAAWSQIGKYAFRLPKFTYNIPCMPEYDMYESLGAIKERNDGRWNWWRSKSRYHKSWNENFGGADQGVAANQGAAEMRVLEGWNG